MHLAKRTGCAGGERVRIPVTQTIDREPRKRPPEEHRKGPRAPSARERRLTDGCLLAIGVVSLLLHVLLVPGDWPAGWDESVYLSQVTPGIEGYFFMAWHARGITLIVAPVTYLGGSVADVRLFLMVLSAIAVTVTYRLWVPLVGMAAAVAAFVFSFSWQGFVLASEVKPNYWGALLCLAATALIARRLEGGRTRDLILASVVLAAAALVRPTEATVLTGAIGLFILIWKRTSWRDVIALGIGLLLGWLPWIIEMSVRFGGLTGALEEARKGQHFVMVPLTENVLRHLAYTDGKSAASAIPGAIWWSVLVLMAAAALTRGVKRSDRASALLCSLGALALAAEYLIFVPALAPRFLLPAYALASVPFAIGLVSLLRGSGAFRVLGVVVLLLMIPWMIWQGTVVTRRIPSTDKAPALQTRVGTKIRRLAQDRPCFVLSQPKYPQIAYTAGCSGEKAGPRLPSDDRLTELARGDRVVFVLRIVEAPKRSLLSSVEPMRFGMPGRKVWFLYELPRPPG